MKAEYTYENTGADIFSLRRCCFHKIIIRFWAWRWGWVWG